MYSTAATPPPFASSPLPSACLSNQASSSAYCPLPAGLPPFASAVKASIKERERVGERDEEECSKLGIKPGRDPRENHNHIFSFGISRHNSAAYRRPPLPPCVVPLFRSHRLDFIIRPARW